MRQPGTVNLVHSDMEISDLPHLNATLNATSAVLLLAGYAAIRRKRPALHKRLMLAAVAVSCAFLVSYLIYHFHHLTKKFEGEGPIRTLYFAILLSHTVLAMSLVYFVPVTVRRALRGDLAGHRKIARWTFPIWLYVSLTGVAVYWMLYQL